MATRNNNYRSRNNMQRSSNSARKRRMAMKRRRQIVMRNRIILGCVIALFLVVVIFLFKGCSGKDSSSESKDKGGALPDSDLVTNTEAVKEEATIDNTPRTSKGYVIENKDGCTYIDGILIANKTYALPETFIPTDPDVPVTAQWSVTSLDKTLMTNWKKMQSDASAKGLNIYIASGYRSYSQQIQTYNSYVAKDGKEMADTYSSRAGHSEHQTGLCFDLNSVEDSFQYTSEGKWVNENAYKYGFCIRFPKGKDEFTGYQYESWHLRYVGVELATKLYNNGDWISLEEYFGITSKYED